VLIATDSKYLPYERYPLNFEAWLTDNFEDAFEVESRFQASNKFLFFQPESFYKSPFDLENADEYGDQALLLKHKFTKIDPETRIAHLANGDAINYDKCLLALGSESPQLDLKMPQSLKGKFLTLDNLDDFFSVKEALSTCGELVVVGDSLKAIEFAACQSSVFNGDVQRQVTLISRRTFLEDYLPENVVKWVKPEIEKTGVKIIENVDISKMKVSSESFKSGSKVLLSPSNEQNISCDNVVSMLPRKAKCELATNSALEVNSADRNTIVADSTLKVRTNLYAAGSCVSVYHPILKSRLSFDMADHSVMSGRFAAFNMMGKTMPYFKLPRLVADFGDDLGFDGVGMVDPTLETQVYFVHKSHQGSTEVVGKQEKDGEQAVKEAIHTKSNNTSETSPTNVTASTITTETESNASKDDKKQVENLKLSSNSSSKDVKKQQVETATEVTSDSAEKETEQASSPSIESDPIVSCAVVYVKDGVVVGVVTIGAFGRMFIAENMISHKVKAADVHEYVPLLLATKFSLKKPNEEDDDNMF